ncbi:hypothetical protein K440DRAFT_589996, partial [Wilcoxina mikolae CBS 423.85]
MLRFNDQRYQKISREHESSLQWIWTEPHYQKWTTSNLSELLYIQGKPGSGKSTLMKYVNDNLLERDQNARSALLSSFFYSFRDGERQTSHYSMLRTLLYGLFHQCEYFLYIYQHEYRKLGRPAGDLTEWPYETLKRVLLSLGDYPTPGGEPVYLLIDAVDESDEKDRRNILKLLLELCAKRNCVIKVIVASRPVVELDRDLDTIRMQDKNEPDIRNFVKSFLGPDLNFLEQIITQAIEYIVEHAQGVFLWVRLIRDEIVESAEEGCCAEDIIHFLKSLPIELEGLYERSFQRMILGKERNIMDGIKIFQWILYSCRGLTIDELQHALAIPDDPEAEFVPTTEAFEKRKIWDMQKRIICCGRNFLDIKDGVVQVMHQTVREFFTKPDGTVSSSRFHTTAYNAHSRISTTCIRYLLFCATYTLMDRNCIPEIASWKEEHYESYARYLHERPFINYVILHLKDHLD